MANPFLQNVANSSLGGSSKKCPLGSHDAMCVQIVDQGLRNSGNGEYYAHRFVFEVQDDDDPENPYIISTPPIATSLSPKSKLRKMFVNWRSRDFSAEEIAKYSGANGDIDLLYKNVIGAGATINVVEGTGADGKIYHNLNPEGISNLNKKRWFKPVTPLVFFSIQLDFPTNKENQEQLRMLPEWVQQQAFEKNATLKEVYRIANIPFPTWEEWSSNTETSQSTEVEPELSDDIPF